MINKQYVERNKEKRKQYAQAYRENNKDKIKAHYESNKDTILANQRHYVSENQEEVKEYKKQYYQKNKFKRNEKDRIRKNTDIIFKLMSNMRSRINNVLRQNKQNHTIYLIGCKKTELIDWINYQLNNDLTWDNYGKLWHIDHVIPLSFFNLNDVNEQKLAFNWSNLRPFLARENLKKNCKIYKDDTIIHMDTLKEFTNLNTGYQTNEETCWWRRVELRYGKNPKDEENFEGFLKWIIRSEASENFEKPKKI